MIAKSYHWQKIALAIAATAFFSLLGFNAAAFSLGRITVQSALGEPLRAEIDVLDINAEEAASLKTSVALPQAFKAAGLDYNPALASLQATLQRRADGRAFIRLSSQNAINDPFVDLILEANWSSGRVVRDYTLLLDPPSLRSATSVSPATPSLPQIPTPPVPNRMDTPAPVTGVPPTTPTPITATPITPTSRAAAQNASVRRRSGKIPARVSVAKAASTQPKQVSVKSGDTASQIAVKTRPANISLDQMLVALLRANPDAFIGANVNRIKAGSVMNIPSAEQAGSTPSAEATQIIVAQSKDFNDFRRKLAGSAPRAQVVAADRKASGTVQAKVQDQKPLSSAADKLTLSKGASPDKASDDQLAKERSAKAASDRAAEIAKNIRDLSQLGAASSVVAPALSASAATPSGLVAPAASAAKPAASAAVKRPLASPVPPAANGLIDDLIDKPLVPAGAVGLIALLAGLGFYRSRQRKSAAQVDSSFLESRMQPDSFFGSSGGASVDTNESPASGSSMVYTPSQLDAVDAVDPVAEADVYLAYGRDLQAEEILKDALRVTPERIAIHQKLLEIYAKRHDVKSFADIAGLLVKLTQGQGPDWQRACELGLSIDPDNALYQVGVEPTNGQDAAMPPPADTTGTATDPIDLMATQVIERPGPASIDLDLDLDFSLEEVPATATEPSVVATGPAAIAPVPDSPLVPDLDFKLGAEDDLPLAPDQALASTDPLGLSEPEAAVIEEKLELPAAVSDKIKAPVQASSGPDLSLLEFDLGSLSLDLEPPAKPSTVAQSEPEDPQATKLALAQEFRAIGDEDGARSLIEEVIAEASGDMKIKAQNALKSL